MFDFQTVSLVAIGQCGWSTEGQKHLIECVLYIVSLQVVPGYLDCQLAQHKWTSDFQLLFVKRHISINHKPFMERFAKVLRARKWSELSIVVSVLIWLQYLLTESYTPAWNNFTKFGFRCPGVKIQILFCLQFLPWEYLASERLWRVPVHSLTISQSLRSRATLKCLRTTSTRQHSTSTTLFTASADKVQLVARHASRHFLPSAVNQSVKQIARKYPQSLEMRSS